MCEKYIIGNVVDLWCKGTWNVPKKENYPEKEIVQAKNIHEIRVELYGLFRLWRQNPMRATHFLYISTR